MTLGVCGGLLTRTFRFLIISDCEGARRRLSRDGTASEELLPASLQLASPAVSVQVASALSPAVALELVAILVYTSAVSAQHDA